MSSTIDRISQLRDTQPSLIDYPVAPAGKMRMAEYGQAAPALCSQSVLVDSAESVTGNTLHLSFKSRGYACSGAVMIWREAHWSVWCEMDGAIHGTSYPDTTDGEYEARAKFFRQTNLAAVILARAERERIHAECAKIQAERDAERRAWYLTACAERGLNPATKKARRYFNYTGAA